MAKLSPKHRMFVKEYLKDRNATRAYIACGYSKKGSTQSASRLLANANIQDAIETGLARLAAKADVTAERVINRIADFAFGSSKKLRASDILKANELLGKHLKLFTDVQVSTVTATVVTASEAEVKETLAAVKRKL